MVKPCLNVWTGLSIVCILLVASCTPASRVTPPVTTVNMPVTPTPTATPILPKQSNSLDLIVFQSFRNGEEAIYYMGDNGMGQTRLVSGVDPAWSPDGKRLAYSQIVDDKDMIYIMERGEPDTVQLTSGFTPTWSPDGTRLSFSDLHQDNNDIFLINSDGSGRVPLTGHPSDELYPSWAPDGQHVAFERDGQIWIARLADGHQTILSTGDAIDSTPAWSFDGQWIAFSSRFEDTNGNGQIDYNDNSQIMVASTDGTNRTALTAFPEENAGQPIWAQNPDWSPDGTRLAFESNRDGQWDIWVINRNDRTLKNLTAEAKGSVNLNPHWLPTVN